MSEDTRSFGRALYDELKRLGYGSIVTERLNYAQVQRLKAADRPEVIRLFRGSDYEAIQRIKEDSAADLASYLVERAREAERERGNHQLAAIVIMGMLLTGR